MADTPQNPQQNPVAPPLPSTKPQQPPTAPKHIRPKLGKNVIGCTAAIAVSILLGLSVIALAVAKTGAFQIPLFSDFYSGPIPTRLVSAEPMTANAFKVLLSSRLFSQSLTKKSPPYAIKLNEKEITAVLQTAIDTALRDQKWKQVFTQIVIRQTDLEMLSQYERGPIRLNVLVRFVPVMEDGGVRFDPVFAQVGDYRIPSTIAYTVLGYLFSRDLGTWSIKFGDMSLSEIRLHDAYLDAVVSSRAPAKVPEELK